ncbi:restriction endonuclease subunit S [Vreelandella venusta]|uniref:restriction endonuclease subunit S n=1 Tax=Vreelandella venusta TaxID=44935 RepID=UPI00384BAB7A
MSSAAEFKWGEIVLLDDLVSSGEVQLGRGNVISKIDIRNNPGQYPIYSSSSKNDGKMGEYGSFMFDEELISWSVDGGGYFFHRPKHKFSVTNVSGYMRLSPSWDYRFTAYSLQFQHEYFSFDYQTKAHPSVIREFYLFPKVPHPEQKKIAAILSSVDRVIEKTRAQIDKLKDLKTGMMQELLTKGVGPGGISHTEFKTSPLGKIPAVWKIATVESLLSNVPNPMRSGPFGSALLKKELVTDGIPFLGIDNVHVEYFRQSFKRFITEDKFKELKRYEVFPGDVMVTIMGTVGRCCVVPDGVGKAISSKHVWTITLDKDKYVPELLCWQINYANWVKQQFKNESQGGVMDSISSGTLKNLVIPVPPIEEQRKIVKVYRGLTSSIEKKESKLCSIQSLKKSLMQDLLTGKVRVSVEARDLADA